MLFQKLPVELVELILKHCYILAYKDKCIRLLFPGYKYLIIKEKKQLIQNHFDKHIIEMFGGMTNILEYPIIQFKKTYQYKISKLCYIDNIKPIDMEYPIMIGIDFYDRGFVCIKHIKNNQECVEILFQLYQNKQTWKHTSCYNQCLYDKNNYIISNGKKINIVYEHFKNYIKNIF